MSEPSRNAFMPREELIEKSVSRRQMTIGIPREKRDDEKRISLTPEGVKLLTDAGHEIYIEQGAGVGANFSDKDYSENGAVITDIANRAYECDMVIKVTPFNEQEAEMLRGNQLVISFMNAALMNQESLLALMRKRVTALASEKIKDSDGIYPVVESMSEIEGITSALLASEFLCNSSGGKGVMLGGITGVTPTEVVILGATTAGEYAARAVQGLGAVIRVFDNSGLRLRNIQNILGNRLFTSTYHTQVLKKVLKTADVLICASNTDDLAPQFNVSEEMVREMKKGSVIIDLTSDNGKCIETSECRALKDPVYEKHGVVHFSAWNLPSRVPKTASIALSNIFRPLLNDISDSGGITTMLKFHDGLRNGVYLYNGILTSETLANKFNLLAKDINLLLAAF